MRLLVALTLLATAVSGCSLLFQESSLAADASPNSPDATSSNDPDAESADLCSWLEPDPQLPLTIICDDFESTVPKEQWRQQRSGDGFVGIVDAPDRPGTHAFRFSALAEDDAFAAVATDQSQLRIVADFYVEDVNEIDLIEFLLEDGSIIELVIVNGALFLFDGGSGVFHNAQFTVPVDDWWSADLRLNTGLDPRARLTITSGGSIVPSLVDAPISVGKIIEVRVGVAGGAGTVFVDNAAILAPPI